LTFNVLGTFTSQKAELVLTRIIVGRLKDIQVT
jgi:hypothetical protein